jgi:peptidoglycan/LPS O-acetylase OafA/YrhL
MWWEWLAIAVTVCVLELVRRPGWVARALSVRPLVYVGTISYGVYVYHNLIPTVGRALEHRFGIWLRVLDVQPWRFVFMAGAAVGIAALSWRFLERPFNDLKRYAPYTPTPTPTLPPAPVPVLATNLTTIAS